MPSLGTGWDITGLGGDGPGVWMALAQRSVEEAFFFSPGASNRCQKALGTFKVLNGKPSFQLSLQKIGQFPVSPLFERLS